MEATNRDILLNPRTGRGAGLESLPASRLSGLLTDAPGVAKALLASTPDERADTSLVFRSISAIMVRALDAHDRDLFASAVESFAEIWGVGDPRAMYPLTTPDLEASLWEGVVVELLAVGGLAVAQEGWADVRLIVRTETDSAGRDRSWLRQGQVASARSMPPDVDETVLDVAVRRIGELNPALSYTALALVCRFDLLAALMIVEADPEGFYPNCAPFSESLVEPLVVESLRSADAPLRQSVFRGDDAGLREALRLYDEKARIQAAIGRRSKKDWRWRGFSDARTLIFISSGQRLEEFEAGTGWT